MYSVADRNYFSELHEELKVTPEHPTLQIVNLIGYDLARYVAKNFREESNEIIKLPLYSHVSTVGELCDKFGLSKVNKVLREVNMGIQLEGHLMGYKVVHCETSGTFKGKLYWACYDDVAIAASMKHEEDPVEEALDLILTYQIEGLRKGTIKWYTFEKLGQLLKDPAINEQITKKLAESGWDLVEKNFFFKMVPLS